MAVAILQKERREKPRERKEEEAAEQPAFFL